MLRKYIAPKIFYKELFIIIIPIIIQFFVQNFINFLDNIMVGQLGEGEIAGVAVANQYYKIFYPILVSICQGAAIFTAQYYGQGNYQEVQKIFSIKLIFPSLATLFFFFVGVLFPQRIIGFFVDANLDAYKHGVKYLKIVIWSYLPLSISSAFAFTLRPLKLTHIPMIAVIVGMSTNALLNFLLIYGFWIFPALGVEGAAIATVIARIMELIVYIVLFFKNDYPFKTKIANYFKIDLDLVRKTFVKVVPLFFNEVLFTSALTIIFKTYSNLGQKEIAVINIADVISQIVYILASGLGTATNIFVGIHLGNNELKEAEDNANYLLGYSVGMGIIITFILSIISFIVPHFYNIQPQTKVLTTYVILIHAFMAPVTMLTRIPFFVLRSGGRVYEVLLLDAIFMWIVKVPVAIICGYVLHFPILPLFLAVEATRILNATISMALYKKKRWLTNLTS